MSASALAHLLLALALIVAVSRATGAVFAAIGQPRVIGEMFAGIALGPSLLGRMAPAASSFLLPSEIAPQLGAVAQVGVVLFMFLVGLELDTSVVRERTRASLWISVASIGVPFALGLIAAVRLHPAFAPRGIALHVFAPFIGVAMAVTAFPVLARILTDRHMQKTKLGVLALTSAAFGDVIAWCLLAMVVGIAKADTTRAIVTILLTIAFVLSMILVARRGMVRLARRHAAERRFAQDSLAFVAMGLLLSALVTEWIGVHALFGAFLFGAIIPHDSQLAHDLEAKLTDIVVLLLLPVFFANSGMHTQLGLVQGSSEWLVCALLIVLATVGKVGGVFAAARLAGMETRDAATLGVLMNTRGLMELVVLNVGLDLGVISPKLFAMLVLMALATTVSTAPMLALVRRGERYS